MRILFTISLFVASAAYGAGLGGGGASGGFSPFGQRSFPERCRNAAGEFVGNGFGNSRWGPTIQHFPDTPEMIAACENVTNDRAFACVMDLRKAENAARPPQVMMGALFSSRKWHFLPLKPAAVANCGRIRSKVQAECLHEATSRGFFDAGSIGFCGSSNVGIIEQEQAEQSPES
jgi:hypothetical protein